MIATILQWVGFAGIMAGYSAFKSNTVRGAMYSVGGGVALFGWCFYVSPFPYGIAAMQAVCIGLNVATLIKARKV